MNQKTLLTLTLRRIRLRINNRTQSTGTSNIPENIATFKTSESEEIKENLEEWKQARAFDTIPGPKPLPLIGNTWRIILPKIGDLHGLDFLDIHRKLHHQYGDIAILKGIFLRQPIIFLFNPKDIEKLFRHEGSWPVRKGMPSLRQYRKLRKHLIPKQGLITLEGEEWYKFRTIVNPVVMKPENSIQYTDKINAVADEFIDNIRNFSQKNKEGEMPADFENELCKYTAESIGVVMMDIDFGFLKRTSETNTEPQKLMGSILQVFKEMYNLDILPAVWKVVSTPSWRRFVKSADCMTHKVLELVNKRLEQLEKGENLENDEIKSVLFQLAKVDRDIAAASSVEMMLTGVDTTAKVLASGLYYLAKNPQKQEKLRQEAFSLLESKSSPVTKETLMKNSYTKATIKEILRLATVANGVVRISRKNMVLGGYQIPPGVHILTSNLLISNTDEYFPKPAEFLPERWLSTTTGELSHKNVNPFVFLPFGFGPRSCAGKRLANLELEIALLKIIRNFELEWPHEDMVFKTYILHSISQPLRVHVKEI